MHRAIPFDDLSKALACKEAEIIPKWIRATIDLANEGSLDQEAPNTDSLTEFFGPYSHTAKVFRTLGGPKEQFGIVAYFLSKVAFVALSPHIMHCGRAGYIIAAWRGTTLSCNYAHT